uniref:Isoform 3 of FMRFamide neuropeptides n=1 Tax=Lymnaea stagnalis TaxID=6523 RepID=P19802-2
MYSPTLIVCLSFFHSAVTKRFLRFGRALDTTTKRFLRFGRALDTTDPFIRLRRQFYRIGRGGYQPYQDKRFLRFGRSEQPDVDDYLRDVVLQSEEPLYRKRRSTEAGGQSEEMTHRTARSAPEPAAENREIMKRETGAEDLDEEKRFMRFGRGDEEAEKRFMRFGKSFMRFGRDMSDVDKRFMRFGKRFMRFGREPGTDKRFMRFGREPGADKRFMRFGKSFDGEEENDDDLYYNESDADSNDDVDKRFMRFGKSAEEKRFMRFGKSEDASRDKKEFLRIGKRESRSAEVENNIQIAAKQS